MPRHQSIWFTLFVCVVAGALNLAIVACDDQGDEIAAIGPVATATPVGGVSFAQVQQQVLIPNCATSGCHVTGAQAPNLTGAPEGVERQLLTASGVNGVVYIAPGDPEGSLLYRRMEGTEPNRSTMPPTGLLPQVQRDLVREYIEGL